MRALLVMLFAAAFGVWLAAGLIGCAADPLPYPAQPDAADSPPDLADPARLDAADSPPDLADLAIADARCCPTWPCARCD